MKNQTLRTQNPAKKSVVQVRKVLQILAVYAFALVAAVACGKGFAVKSDNDKVSEQGGFNPTFTKSQKTPVADGYEILYAIADGSRAVSLKTSHSEYKVTSPATTRVDGVDYTIDDVCTGRTCSEVIVLITRVMEGKTVQSALMFHVENYDVLANQSYALADLIVVARLSNTNFSDPMDAHSALQSAVSATDATLGSGNTSGSGIFEP